jgi:hypothetical protein
VDQELQQHLGSDDRRYAYRVLGRYFHVPEASVAAEQGAA